MAILPILRFPDPRLRAFAEPVERLDTDLRQLDGLFGLQRLSRMKRERVVAPYGELRWGGHARGRRRSFLVKRHA